MFNLKTTTEELKGSNNGISEVQYMQVSADKPIAGDNFSGGKIDFKFSMSGDRWWVPSKSYVYMDVELTKGNNAALELKDDVAPNQGLCSNLFSSAEFIVNGTTICSVTDNLAQCEALEHRMNKSDSLTKSLSKSTNFWARRHEDRQADIINNKKLGVQRSISLNKLALGFDAAVTVTVTKTTGAVAFTAASSAGIVFKQGDILVVSGYELQVVSITDAQNMVVQAQVIAADITAATDFNRIRTENTDARNAPKTELIWQPLSLGIFKIDHALPCGDYTLRLTPFPNSVYPIRAFETTALTKNAGTTANDVKLNVKNMYFYCHTLKGDRVDNKNYLIDLENINCQRTAITSASFTQNDFTIEPSTYGIACAYQHQSAGNDTKFSASKFKAVNNEELNLNRFFIQYDGQKYPQIDANNEFKVGTDRTIQRYYETQQYNGAAHDIGGCEDIQTYHSNGQYFYFAVPKDGSSRATRLNVHQNFSALSVNPNLLVFSYYRSVAQVQIEDGRVIQVQVENN